MAGGEPNKMSKRTKRLKFEAIAQEASPIKPDAKPVLDLDLKTQTIGQIASMVKNASILSLGPAEFKKRFDDFKTKDLRLLLEDFGSDNLDTNKEVLLWFIIYLDSLGL